jgi:hypothetical protein
MTNETVSAELAAIELSDEHGKKFRLGDLWRERPIVVAWVRHFG